MFSSAESLKHIQFRDSRLTTEFAVLQNQGIELGQMDVLSRSEHLATTEHITRTTSKFMAY